MSANTGIHYSLNSLFWLVTAIAMPLGLSVAWGGDKGLLTCIGVASVLFAVTRRKFFGAALLGYIIALVFACIYVIRDTGLHGPYVRRYNERLEKMAIDAKLVGGPKESVEAVLGPATDIWNYSSSTHIDTGEPTPDARYVTTYNYAPYPSFPSAKFQVHCEHGVVQSIELYDD